MSLPKTVAHLLVAGEIAGGREYGDGLRRWTFTTNKGKFFVKARKSYMSPWSIEVGRYRTEEEVDTLCRQHRIQGNVFDIELLHHENLPKSATLPALNKRINQVWAEIVGSGKLAVAL